MGRITVFSLDGCPYCKQVMAALDERDIPYVEINVSEFPEKRDKVFGLTNRASIPQVFFNTRHVGGCDDTLALLSKWDQESKFASPRARYEYEIGNWPDPTNPVLQVPSRAAERVSSLPNNFCEDRQMGVLLPDGSSTCVMGITERLKTLLPHNDLERKGSVYKNSFRGTEAVEAFREYYSLSVEEAVAFGKSLLSLKIMHHVTDKRGFENNEDYYYRLQCYHTPYILNSYRPWDEPGVKNTPEQVIQHLAERQLQIEEDVTDKMGLINYEEARGSKEFAKFEESVCELQSVDLGSLTDYNTKLAFSLNVYIIMMQYAFVKIGIPKTDAARAAFLKEMSFNIGGYQYSFQEWMDGILRCNKPTPLLGNVKTFSKKDPRFAFAMTEFDIRVLFALNFWGRSCAIKLFTAGNLDKELDLVAIAFCEDDANVALFPEKNEIHLASILNLYKADFGTSSRDLQSVLFNFMVGIKRQKMLKFLSQEKSQRRMSFNKQEDWSANAKGHVEFVSRSACPNTHACPIKRRLEEQAMVLKRQVRSTFSVFSTKQKKTPSVFAPRRIAIL